MFSPLSIAWTTETERGHCLSVSSVPRTSFSQDPHLHQVRALQVLLQDGVVRHGELPCLLVVADDEGGVPLGGSLHPVDGESLPHQDGGSVEQEPLGLALLHPSPHLRLAPPGHRQARQGGVPLLHTEGVA